MRKTAVKGTLIGTAAVAAIGGKSAKTIEAWIRDGVLPPTDYLNDQFAVFDRKYIEEVTNAMQTGRESVAARVSELRALGRNYWRVATS